MSLRPAAGAVVIDTNWVLDLLVFEDPRSLDLGLALQAGSWRWLACEPMQDELLRVLDYPLVARRLQRTGLAAQDVMARYRSLVHLQALPPSCGVRCTDPDDQVFVDLAACHGAALLSKDKAVLALRRRLEPLGVAVSSAWISQ